MGYGEAHGDKKKLSLKRESNMQQKENLLNENAVGNTATSMGEKKSGVITGSYPKGSFMKKSSFERYKPKKSGESYDMKEAYNKDLTEGARFNYLKNAIHDKNKK